MRESTAQDVKGQDNSKKKRTSSERAAPTRSVSYERIRGPVRDGVGMGRGCGGIEVGSGAQWETISRRRADRHFDR